MNEKKIKIGLEMRESFHRAMKATAAHRDVKLHQVTDEVLARGLSSDNVISRFDVETQRGIEAIWHSPKNQFDQKLIELLQMRIKEEYI